MNRFPAHIVLIALFPVLFLYANNVAEVSASEIILPALIVLLVAGILYAIAARITGAHQKCALIISLFVLLFFSFSHIADAVSGSTLWGISIGRGRYMLAATVLFFALGSWMISRVKTRIGQVTQIANAFATVMILSSISAGLFNLTTGSISPATNVVVTATKTPAGKPDIYYLVVDAYARDDILREIFNHDNSDFVGFLENTGFFVASQSNANYSQTVLSAPSSLNMTYLDEIASAMGPNTRNTLPLAKMIASNRVVEFLAGLGYETVCFSSGVGFTELKGFDQYLSDSWIMSDFENMLLWMTPIPRIVFALESKSTYNEACRQRLLYTLENLPNVPDHNRPRFIFAHFMAPHAPFLFDAEGNELNPGGRLTFFDAGNFTDVNQYRQQYSDYVTWLNQQLTRTVSAILANSDQPPVILLQSDHGIDSYLMWGDSSEAAMRERMAILNAYYLPDTTDVGFYDQISPVNSFQVILNHLFGTGLPILEDRSYFSPYDYPYRFTDVTEQINPVEAEQTSLDK